MSHSRRDASPAWMVALLLSSLGCASADTIAPGRNLNPESVGSRGAAVSSAPTNRDMRERLETFGLNGTKHEYEIAGDRLILEDGRSVRLGNKTLRLLRMSSLVGARRKVAREKINRERAARGLPNRELRDYTSVVALSAAGASRTTVDAAIRSIVVDSWKSSRNPSELDVSSRTDDAKLETVANEPTISSDEAGEFGSVEASVADATAVAAPPIDYCHDLLIEVDWTETRVEFLADMFHMETLLFLQNCDPPGPGGADGCSQRQASLGWDLEYKLDVEDHLRFITDEFYSNCLP